jgi:drug/metabolite transporter (DMT)-like permease
MSRLQATMAMVASALLTIFGVYFGLTEGNSDAATMGWVFAFVGAVGLVVNLVLRTRLR